MFRPKPKWGPISFMKLTHEALRFGMPNLVEHVKTLEAAGAVCSPAAVADLVETFDACMATYKAHGGHEDDILFPAVRRYFPGLNPGADEDHERQHAVLDTMVAAVGQWKANPSAEGAGATLLAALQKDLPAFSTDVLEHLRSEEATITVAARKHLPLDVQRELSNRVFSHNSAEEWAVIIPYTLRNLAMPPWKVQFLRTFIWANPARAQEIGLITYRGVDSVTWCQVSEAIPEMIPRGVAGHKRFY
jgi:iron-sulfur cluster repair protein YtfE (RIC family)